MLLRKFKIDDMEKDKGVVLKILTFEIHYIRNETMSGISFLVFMDFRTLQKVLAWRRPVMYIKLVPSAISRTVERSGVRH